MNGVGALVGGASARRCGVLQTGSVRAYAASLLLGVVLDRSGYYLWR